MLIANLLPAAFQALAALALVCLLVPAFVGSVQGQMLCSKPLQPLCSLEGQAFADSVARSQCRDDIRSYLADLREFRRCLSEAADRAQREVAEADRYLRCLENGADRCSLETQPTY